MRTGAAVRSDGAVTAAEPADLTGAAERLRSWLDELAGRGDDRLADWHRAHAAPLIAAALALEALAAAPEADSGP
jgi:hypothetical protein